MKRCLLSSKPLTLKKTEPKRPKVTETKCEKYIPGDQSVFYGLSILSVYHATEQLSKEMAQGGKRFLTVGINITDKPEG